MKYFKPALTIEQQIFKLRNRGLRIPDEKLAARYLSNISYYRLRAYTFPFQDNDTEDQPFIGSVCFNDVIELYTFDRRLRLLLFDAIERIEIALRTQIIYQWAQRNGSHWHTEQHLYKCNLKFKRHIDSLKREINRCNETFIKHYMEKYKDPSSPPSWMSLEVTSLGLLSLIFENLSNCTEKKAVTHHFGLFSNEVLENWVHNFNNIRNICAHHGRLWNRRITVHLNIPRKTKKVFIKNKDIIPFKLYASLAAMVYCLKIINPESGFKQNLLELLQICSEKQLKEMGFPQEWEKEEFWKVESIFNS